MRIDVANDFCDLQPSSLQLNFYSLGKSVLIELQKKIVERMTQKDDTVGCSKTENAEGKMN